MLACFMTVPAKVDHNSLNYMLWGISESTSIYFPSVVPGRSHVHQISVLVTFELGMYAGTLAGLFWLQKAKSNTVAGAQQSIGLLFFELLFLSFRTLCVPFLPLHSALVNVISASIQ